MVMPDGVLVTQTDVLRLFNRT